MFLSFMSVLSLAVVTRCMPTVQMFVGSFALEKPSQGKRQHRLSCNCQVAHHSRTLFTEHDGGDVAKPFESRRVGIQEFKLIQLLSSDQPPLYLFVVHTNPHDANLSKYLVTT